MPEESNIPSPDPDSVGAPAPKPPRHTPGWSALSTRARAIASVTALFLFLIGLGVGGGYYLSQSHKKATSTTPQTTVSTLTPEDIAKLGDVSSHLGGTGQILNIGADALFRSKVDVTDALTVGGRLSVNGPMTIAQLNLSGPAAGTTLNLSSNLAVGGNTTLQQTLTVGGLTTLSGGANIGGTASVNNLNASSIAVRNLTIAGPLTVAHLQTQGPTPLMVTGSLGSGGTASISGNDTAGTVNFNTGSNPPAGILGTITFRAAYSSSVHVLLTPLTSGAATTSVYVTRTSGGFQVHAASVPPSASTLSFDYLVTQ